MEVTIHMPKDPAQMAAINKELAGFYFSAAVQYIHSLNLNTRQLDTLYGELETAIASKRDVS